MTSGNWYREFQPKSVEELAVNPQKFCETKGAIKEAFQAVDQNKFLQGKKLLVLYGPPGCGKSATLNLAINFINQESEQCKLRRLPNLPYIYINRFNPYPVGSSCGGSYPNFYESAITRFNDWINDNVWFTTPEALKNNFKAQVLLLEELPFTSNQKEQKAKFMLEIKNYLKREDVRMPMIWIITETSVNIEDWKHVEHKSTDTVYNIVPNDILGDQRVIHIRFRTVAQTFLKRGLGAFLDWKFKNEAIKRECAMKIMERIVDNGVNDIRQALNSIQNAYILMETTGKIPSFISPHKYNRAGKLLNAPRKPLLNTPTKSFVDLPIDTISEIRSITNDSVNFKKNVDQFESLDLVFKVKKPVIDSNPRRIISNMQIDYEKFGDLAFSNYLEFYSSNAELASASEVFSNYDILHANNYNSRNCILILMNGLIDSRIQDSPKSGFIQHKSANTFNFNRSMRENQDCLWSIKRGKQCLFEEDNAIGTQNTNFIMANHNKEDLAMSVLPYLRQMSKFDKSNVLKISENGKKRLGEFGKFRRI